MFPHYCVSIGWKYEAIVSCKSRLSSFIAATTLSSDMVIGLQEMPFAATEGGTILCSISTGPQQR